MPDETRACQSWLIFWNTVLCQVLILALTDSKIFDLPVGMCRKPKFGSYSVFKNRTVQKFDIRSDGLPIETECNTTFK